MFANVFVYGLCQLLVQICYTKIYEIKSKKFLCMRAGMNYTRCCSAFYFISNNSDLNVFFQIYSNGFSLNSLNNIDLIVL